MTKDIPVNRNFSVQQVIEKAQVIADEQGTYANYIQMSLTNNDAVFDFYQIAPVTGKPLPKAFMVQRMVIPLSLLKGFTTALANSIAQFEIDNKDVILPNSREKQPGDQFEIWKTTD
jgi:hypothetical protein